MRKKVYTRYEDIPQTQRNQFQLIKHFKNDRHYERFIKFQQLKRRFRLFFWSPQESISTIGSGKTITFYKAKLL